VGEKALADGADNKMGDNEAKTTKHDKNILLIMALEPELANYNC